MARQIIILNDPQHETRGLKKIECLFWIPVAANVAFPLASVRSAAPSLTQAESDALAAGTIVERPVEFTIPDNMDERGRAVAAAVRVHTRRQPVPAGGQVLRRQLRRRLERTPLR